MVLFDISIKHFIHGTSNYTFGKLENQELEDVGRKRGKKKQHGFFSLNPCQSYRKPLKRTSNGIVYNYRIDNCQWIDGGRNDPYD